ncbi:MAG: hypothetical protein NTW50_01045 [Candidatus Berkelbacteria bacterium]|nr:hypothetical protein [Candidatus Berkelbacteria bacterium]
MASPVHDSDTQQKWLLQALSLDSLSADVALSEIWNQLLEGDVEADFGNAFSAMASMLHDLEQLEREIVIGDEEKQNYQSAVEFAMAVQATHDVLYKHHSTVLRRLLTETIDEEIYFFDNLETNIGDSLNGTREDFGLDESEDHPIIDLLVRRDRLGYIILGIRFCQLENQYFDVDVDEYERRLKLADFTLRKKLLECVIYHYKEYRETMPYAPPDFWWRRIKGHEYREQD